MCMGKLYAIGVGNDKTKILNKKLMVTPLL